METYSDERGTFILRWTRKLKNGSVIRAKSKPYTVLCLELHNLDLYHMGNLLYIMNNTLDHYQIVLLNHMTHVALSQLDFHRLK